MSGVFRIIDPPTPSAPGEYEPPQDTLARGRGGGGVNSSEDARHCSVYCNLSTLWTAPISRPDITQLASEQQQALQATL
jgi:hypothetical protein